MPDAGAGFVFPFGTGSHLVYFAVNGERLLFDGARGKLYRPSATVLTALDDLRDGRPSVGEARSWRGRIDGWASDAEAPVTGLRPLDGLLGDAPPSLFTVYPATACNLACTYCYNQRGTFGAAPRLMSLDTARRTVDWIRGCLGTGDGRGSAQVTIMGGEPLMNAAVTEYLCAALLETTDAAVGVVSNGMLWETSDLAAILARYPDRTFVEISVDGSASRHDGSRYTTTGTGTGTGSHAAAVATCRRLQELGVPVRALAVAGPPFDLVAIAEELMAQRLPRFYINALRPYQYNTGRVRSRSFAEWAEGYARYAAWAVASRRAGLDFDCDLDSAARRLGAMMGGPVAPLSCNAGRKLMAVGPDGYIVPCDKFITDGSFRLGDASDGVDDAARGRWLDVMRANGAPVLQAGACGTCYARRRCRGGCYATQHMLGGIGTIDDEECPFLRHAFLIDLWYLAQGAAD